MPRHDLAGGGASEQEMGDVLSELEARIYGITVCTVRGYMKIARSEGSLRSPIKFTHEGWVWFRVCPL